RTPLGDGGEESRPHGHVRRRICEPASRLHELQRARGGPRPLVERRVYTLFVHQTPRGRVGRRKPRTGGRECAVSARVLHRVRRAASTSSATSPSASSTTVR